MGKMYHRTFSPNSLRSACAYAQSDQYFLSGKRKHGTCLSKERPTEIDLTLDAQADLNLCWQRVQRYMARLDCPLKYALFMELYRRQTQSWILYW